ncbi:hypothetical protein F5884DRAFT_825116 [Xylogone sp. PMI_703]|nr:hypothetical protein F5884DRAFT_825116 [Xylogone sp. PMI_703]
MALHQAKSNARKLSRAEHRKRKRSREDETLLALPVSSQKRQQTLVLRSPIEDTTAENSIVKWNSKEINGIEYWRKEFSWPKEYFEPESIMNHLLARKKSSSSFRGKQSEVSSAAPSSTTPSDQKPREAKSTPYTRPSYTTVLATKGSFMDKSSLGITDASKNLCRILLEREQTVPQDSLFRDDLFENACRKIQDKNEARVIQDIARLIVPSVETLATYGASHFNGLIESDQLEKLTPFVGEVTDTFTSYFMATWQMYFPFLMCEVKCGAAALDIADRQNAHSMTMALRGVVELFRLVKREKELHREILAFSVSHDHRTVRIYGHYPIIDEKETTFYRHPIHTFDFTALDGRERWTAYKFIKNVYDIWVSMHFKRICSVIDEIPSNIHFDSSQDAAPLLDDADSQSSRAASSRNITPDTSLSRGLQGSVKKPKKRRRPVELHQVTIEEGERSPETSLG